MVTLPGMIESDDDATESHLMQHYAEEMGRGA